MITERDIESVGLMAAHCEVWATASDLSYRDREELIRRGHAYRAEQIAMLERWAEERVNEPVEVKPTWRDVVSTVVVMVSIAIFDIAFIIGARALWRLL